MTLDQMMAYLNSLISHVTFSYNEKDCGVDPISRQKFNLWYGKEVDVVCQSIDDVRNGKYFDGKSLAEIYPDITDIEW